MIVLSNHTDVYGGIIMNEQLAILGGKPAISIDDATFNKVFRWPIIGKEDE